MKGKCPITTRKASREDTRPDLVKRDFRAPAPNRLRVADITYVRAVKGFVYAAFVTDVFSRKIVGWALSDSMRSKSLLLQAFNQAVVSAKETAGLIHHSDHGSRHVSIVYNDTLNKIFCLADITPGVLNSFRVIVKKDIHPITSDWLNDPVFAWVFVTFKFV